MEITDKLSLADYLWIRKLRNENCHLMTGNSRPVPLWRQILFWLRKPRNISLYLVRVGNERAGYLLLREFELGCAYITECIEPGSRGMGLGSQMIEFAKAQFPTLIAHIRTQNLPSIRLHTNNGFALQSLDEVAVYVWSRSTA